MIELLKAIRLFAADNASGPLTSIATGGFYREIAPANAVTKYVVITPVSAPLTTTYGGPAYSDCELQFAAYGTDDDAQAIVTALIAAFDTHTFTLASGHEVSALRTVDPMPMPGLPEPDQNGQPVYGWMVSYVFSVTPH